MRPPSPPRSIWRRTGAATGAAEIALHFGAAHRLVDLRRNTVEAAIGRWLVRRARLALDNAAFGDGRIITRILDNDAAIINDADSDLPAVNGLRNSRIIISESGGGERQSSAHGKKRRCTEQKGRTTHLNLLF